MAVPNKNWKCSRLQRDGQHVEAKIIMGLHVQDQDSQGGNKGKLTGEVLPCHERC